MNDEKLIKYLLQESNPEESQAIQEWMDSDQANRSHYEEIKWIWESSRVLLEKSDVEENQAWQKFKTLREAKTSPAPQQNQLFMPSNWFKVAAAVTLIFISAWVYSSFLPQSGRAYFGSVKLESEGTPIEASLLDGSVVMLNRNTSLTYAQKLLAQERSVNLEHGEAFFEVKRNEKKPFVIQAGKVQITVLGTSFHVKTSRKATEIIVVTGSVQAAIDRRRVLLKPDDKLIVNLETGEMIKTMPSNKLYDYYVSKKFRADRLPLGELVDALNDAYGSTIEIDREELKKLPITTTLEYGSLSENLAVIRETLNLKITQRAGKIIIE